MGKRRDRRHAAALGGGGGRRVKLDLWNDDDIAQITGKGVGHTTSANVDAGDDIKAVGSVQHSSPAALPVHVQENPLSLLGQYSDDDGDEDSTPPPAVNGTKVLSLNNVNVSEHVDEQVASFLADLETTNMLGDENTTDESVLDVPREKSTASLTLTEVLKEDGKISTQNGDISENTESLQSGPGMLELGKQGPQLASRSIGTVADHGCDVVCDWQAILLEETGEYYYWNKLTGETTWEKPVALQQHEARMKAREVESSKELDKEQLLENEHVGKVCSSVSSIEPEIESKVDCEHDGPVKALLGVLEQPVASPISDSHIDIQNDSHKDLESGIASAFGNGESGADQAQNDNNLTTSPEPNSCEADEDVMNESCDRAEVSVALLQSPAATLDQNLAGSSEQPAIEAEVRLSDCKAMAEECNNSTDFFWVHTGSQLRRIESELSREEAVVSADAKAQKPQEVAMDRSISDSLQEGAKGTLPVKKTLGFRALRPPVTAVRSPFSVDTKEDRLSEKGEGTTDNLNEQLGLEASPPVNPTPKIELTNGEVVPEKVPGASELDTDMDVDMEVDMDMDDGIPFQAPAVVPVLQVQPTSSLIHPQNTYNPYSYPLPSAVSYMPPVIPPILPAPVTHPPVAALPLFPVATPLYSTSDLWQPPPPPDDAWEPPPPPESEAAPPPLPEEPPPLPPSPEASHFRLASAPPSPPSSPPVLGSEYRVPAPSLYSQFGDESTTQIVQGDKSVAGTYYSDSARLLVKYNELENVNHLTAPPASDAAPALALASTTIADNAAKKAGKAVRGKKRSHSTTVAASLKANKKVSSMVNKWLAAKEELHSSEEDEEDKALFDLEAIEKKRQKEIEEWRSQQLASGGALENANFQPLGTLDWRDRVKHAKKAENKTESKADTKTDKDVVASTKPTAEVAGVANGKTQKRPDLKELSKDLPSGWQAYWDSESGEVYYGNLTTSETSWERPTSTKALA
ncbi:unnamed protein product [Sphagnum troendelagicum]|uniref:WW domain-containing protein n=1 Tax=Sphagnum troendelagicum TaxID=128251 RepID=A0ABP0TND6_9BRYO